MRSGDDHPRSSRLLRGRLGAAGPAAAMMVVGVVIVISRRPDAVTNAQFWAEDGKYWFAAAYNHGAQALLWSYQGYLQTLPRLAALPASGLSLGHAALLFNTIGVLIQAAPAAFLVTQRFAHVGPRWARALVGLAYLLLPNFELNVTITNAQWHLAILAVMVLATAPAARPGARAFDVAVLAASAATGPFAVVLLPAALARAATVRSHRAWYGSLSGVLLALLAIQGVAAVLGHRGPIAQLGISFQNAVNIVAGRIVLPGTLAEPGNAGVFTGGGKALVLATLVTLVALVIVGFAVVRGGASLRIFVLACLAMTGISLLAPIYTPPGVTAWTALTTSNVAERYFLMAEIAWLVCLVWTISRIPRRRLTTAAALALAVGSPAT